MTSERRRPLRVLVVEDDPALADAVRDPLELEGLSVALASDGLEALRSARRERPAIILLDLEMLVMSGAKFRTRQLADSRIADVPVVVVTAARPPLPPEVADLPVIDKPFDCDALLGAIVRHARVPT